jgi:hypothetical protein
MYTQIISVDASQFEGGVSDLRVEYPVAPGWNELKFEQQNGSVAYSEDGSVLTFTFDSWSGQGEFSFSLLYDKEDTFKRDVPGVNRYHLEEYVSENPSVLEVANSCESTDDAILWVKKNIGTTITLGDPQKDSETLESGAGDCIDTAILLYSLIEKIDPSVQQGIAEGFVMKDDGSTERHAVNQILMDGKWVLFDAAYSYRYGENGGAMVYGLSDFVPTNDVASGESSLLLSFSHATYNGETVKVRSSYPDRTISVVR